MRQCTPDATAFKMAGSALTPPDQKKMIIFLPLPEDHLIMSGDILAFYLLLHGPLHESHVPYYDSIQWGGPSQYAGPPARFYGIPSSSSLV